MGMISQHNNRETSQVSLMNNIQKTLLKQIEAKQEVKKKSTKVVDFVVPYDPANPLSIPQPTSRKRKAVDNDVATNKYQKGMATKDTIQSYDTSNLNKLSVDNTENVKIEDKTIRIKRFGEEHVVREKELEEVQELKDAAKIIGKITAREEVDNLIAKYKAKVNGYNGSTNFDHMAMDAHILIMLFMRRDGANSQDLEEIAEMTVIIFRDKIKGEHENWSQMGFALVSGSLMVFGSVAGIAGLMGGVSKVNSAISFVTFGKMSDAFSKGKDLVQAGSFVGQMGQGSQSLGSYWNSKTQGNISYLGASQQIATSKQAQNRDEKRRSDQAIQQAISTIKQIAQNLYNTVLTFARGNYSG